MYLDESNQSQGHELSLTPQSGISTIVSPPHSLGRSSDDPGSSRVIVHVQFVQFEDGLTWPFHIFCLFQTLSKTPIVDSDYER